MTLFVLCPSRGRPEAAKETYQSYTDTVARVGTQLWFVVDADDPTVDGYRNLPALILPADRSGNMVKALNSAAADVIHEFTVRYVGFIGDDHRFRTSAWDDLVIRALDAMEGGIVYGNDLAQGERLPTQVFMSAGIVEALGWMGLPGCDHLYIDNAWLVLGKGSGHLKYLPDVVIEHLHPLFGKGEWDEGHRRVNTPAMYAHDQVAFQSWMDTQLESDLAKIAAVLA